MLVQFLPYRTMDSDQETETTVNVFSVRNIAIGVTTAFIFAAGVVFAFAYKDHIFGSSKSVETSIKDSSTAGVNVFLIDCISKNYFSYSLQNKTKTILQSNSNLINYGIYRNSLSLSSDRSKILATGSDYTKDKLTTGSDYTEDKLIPHIYIRHLAKINNEPDMILIENEYIDESLRPSFSPDDKKVIYATKIGKKSQIYQIAAKINQKANLIQEFDEDSILHLFKYTIDGKFIVALFSKNEKFVLRFIELDESVDEPFKDIEIDPKSCYNDFGDDFEYFKNSFILNFSISKDNAKIVFLFNCLELYQNLNRTNKLYMINRDESEIFIPKKIYETKKKIAEFNSLYWLPNYEEIILNENSIYSCILKIININSDSSVNEKVVELKDSDDKPIEGYCLGLSK